MLRSLTIVLLSLPLVSACGSARIEPGAADTGPQTLGPRYGISITLPTGWHGRISRGAVQAETFPLPSRAAGWVHEDAREHLSEDDVVVSLFETAPENRSPSPTHADYPPITGPLVLWRTVRGEYRIDLRVSFGRPDPTAEMRAEAQAMLDGLVLPEWGPWELEP